MKKNLLFNLPSVLFAIFILTNCSGVPRSFKEQALDDMYPILTDAQFNEMKSLIGDNEIKEFINTYWDSLEASMKSNELRDLYKSRLEYANKHFPDRRGWGRSDRKRVYVIYGPPAYIERKEFSDIPVGSFSTIKAIEIWSYMKPENRNSFPSPLDKIYNGEQRFIFTDMTGSGVYKIFYSTDANEYFDTRILDRQIL